MYNHILYFTYWLVNTFVLYVFGLLYPSQVVLGNWRFSPMEAAIYAGFWVTFFVWSFWDLAMAKGVRFDSSVVTLGYFWSVNIFAFWVVSRFSQYAGFGISNYLWAFTVGLAAYGLQRLVRRVIVGKTTA